MKKTVTKILSLALGAAMIFSLTACGSGSNDAGGEETGTETVSEETNETSEDTAEPVNDTQSGEKNLTFIMNRDTTDMSPFATLSASRAHIVHLLYNYLFVAEQYGDSADKLQGEIAKDYTMADDMTIQVNLYDYVKDSEGNAITAEDIVYSYETFAASVSGTSVAGIMDSITAVDEYTVEIKMKNNAIGNLEYILTGVPIISKAWYDTASDADRTNHPVGTGAYTLAEVVAGSHAIVTKNDDYWQTDTSLVTKASQQPFDTITFRVVLESSMEVIALENGDGDIARQIPVTDLETFSGDEWNIYNNLGGMFYCLFFNNSNSVFADNQALRQAVLYGMDAESIRLAFGNNETSGAVCKTFGTPAYGDYISSWENEDYYDYDPDRAQELMAEAGYADGGLKVRLLYVKNTSADACMTVLQNYLNQLGIEVELLAYDQAMYDSLKYDDTAWDICLDQKGSNTPFMPALWFANFDPGSYDNGSVCFTHDDTLVQLMEAAMNPETHGEESLNAFHEYLRDQAYAVGLFYNYEFFVSRAGINMVQDGGGNLTPSYFTTADDYQSVLDKQ